MPPAKTAPPPLPSIYSQPQVGQKNKRWMANDKNYAAHYAFLDHLFGTRIKGQSGFPEKYGVQGDYMPDGFTRQLGIDDLLAEMLSDGLARRTVPDLRLRAA